MALISSIYFVLLKASTYSKKFNIVIYNTQENVPGTVYLINCLPHNNNNPTMQHDTIQNLVQDKE